MSTATPTADDAAKFRAVLEAYELWERDLILDSRAWDTASGLPRFTPELHGRWMEIQAMRNEALGRFRPGSAEVREQERFDAFRDSLPPGVDATEAYKSFRRTRAEAEKEEQP